MNKIRVPKASPEPLSELATFLEPFAPLFRRHTSRDSMERYVTGLLTDLPHKTCETIADVVAGTSLERLQHLLTDAAWDPLALDEARVKRLLALHPVPGRRTAQVRQPGPAEATGSRTCFPPHTYTEPGAHQVLGESWDCLHTPRPPPPSRWGRPTVWHDPAVPERSPAWSVG